MAWSGRSTMQLAAGLITVAGILSGCGTRPTLAPPQPQMLAAVERLGGRPCAATIAASLDASGVGPSDLARITVSRRTAGSNDHEYLQSWDAWVYRTGQTGAIVVRSSPDCSLLTIYTTGGASLPAG